MTHTFQFGTANKPPVLGWTIVLLYPSFQDEESWRLMEKAAVIQGDLSLFKSGFLLGWSTLSRSYGEVSGVRLFLSEQYSRVFVHRRASHYQHGTVVETQAIVFPKRTAV